MLQQFFLAIMEPHHVNTTIISAFFQNKVWLACKLDLSRIRVQKIVKLFLHPHHHHHICRGKKWSGVQKTGSGPVGCPAGRMSSGTGCIIIITFIMVLVYKCLEVCQSVWNLSSIFKVVVTHSFTNHRF